MPVEFGGTERYEVVERLGAGGMGVVYRALDRARGTPVALKTLHRLNPESILLLKQEFRGISHVAHRNLVSMYDLVGEGDTWFFTMELVPGCNFIEWVRPQAPDVAALGMTVTRSAVTVDTLGPEDFAAAASMDGAHSMPPPHLGAHGASPPDFRRLRSALRQLVQAIGHLHAAGVLHRDIKPSNVMVRPDGHVSVLDFGLVTNIEQRHVWQSGADVVVSGTLEYMAPEQTDATPASPASDWYSVGVMLFQALTGQLPFTGSPLKMLVDKRRYDPPSPAQLLPDLPADLVELCDALIQRDPTQRPDTQAMLARFNALSLETTQTTLGGAADSPLFGRTPQLVALRAAYRALASGRPSVVYVHGSSGMGKSVLVRRGLDEISRDPGALVLAGRCFERESVPYKALDGVIDELTHTLTSLSSEDAAALLTPDVRALARLFPVLRHVVAVENLPPLEDVPDPRELRRRAVNALRALWGRLATRHRLVVYIDDLQWGDADSAALLTEVLSGPAAPGLMFLGSYRTEEAAESAFLRHFDAGALAYSGRAPVEIEVTPLDETDACALAGQLLGEGGEGAQLAAEVIARESHGSPFLIEALVGYLREVGGAGQGAAGLSGLSLSEMMRRRFVALTPDARRLLTVTAIAGQPMAREIVEAAASLGAEMPTALAHLRAQHWVRVRVVDTGELIESYHDRIRETLVQGLDPETARRAHRDLGGALEGAGSTDYESLAEHFFGAGERRRAGDYTTRAADRAREVLAFDRAAALYARALELHRDEADAGTDLADELERVLHVRLAEALVDAGRCVEAARAFEVAAALAPGALALDLQRRAGEQLMISGHIAEGRAIIERVLVAIDMQLPSTPRRALLSLLFWRGRLRLRGLGFTPKLQTEVPTTALSRVDLTWAVGLGLGLVDHVGAADYQARSLYYALESGEPYRVARSLGMEVAYAASVGHGGQARVERLRAVADALVPQVDRAHTHGLYAYCLGVAAFSWGRWREAVEHFERAERVYRDKTTGLNWEVASCQTFLLSALGQRGALAEISQRVPSLLQDARDRGNLYAATNLRTGYPALHWLAVDEPETARRMANEAMSEWSQVGFTLQRYFAFIAQTNVDLYQGEAGAAFRRVQAYWPALDASLWLRAEVVRIDNHVYRARCALAALARGVEVGRARETIKADLKALEAEVAPWARPNALQFRGTLAHIAGETPRAVSLLTEAEAAFVAVDMPLHAAAVSLRASALQTSAPSEDALARIVALGARRPEAMADMLAPGFSRG